MDMKSIRTMNLVGTIVFVIFGLIAPLIVLFVFGFVFFLAPANPIFIICFTGLLVYVILIGFFAYKLYQNAVLGIDRGDFENAKRWTLYGAIIGFIFGGGWIALVLFLLSYISFDEALHPKPYYYPPSPYGYPYPPGQYPGPGFPQIQPPQIYPCPTCGRQMRYITQYGKWYCDVCRRYV